MSNVMQYKSGYKLELPGNCELLIITELALILLRKEMYLFKFFSCDYSRYGAYQVVYIEK